MVDEYVNISPTLSLPLRMISRARFQAHGPSHRFRHGQFRSRLHEQQGCNPVRLVQPNGLVTFEILDSGYQAGNIFVPSCFETSLENRARMQETPLLMSQTHWAAAKAYIEVYA